MSYYQQIYNQLRQNGLTEAGALGVLGNFECESNCEPFRVQGDYSSYRTVSKAYVNAVIEGRKDRHSFCFDQKGFGLAQWTFHSRKGELFDLWKQTGIAIDSAQLQVDFTIKELKRDYPTLYSFLCETLSSYDAAYRFCKEFERPAVNNVDARWQAACNIKQQIDLDNWGSTQSQEPENDQGETGNVHIIRTEYWPPRTIDKNMTGLDVQVLQAVLWAREYGISYIDGIFGSYLEDVVKKFQREHNLDADGIVGPLTWAELLKR